MKKHKIFETGKISITYFKIICIHNKKYQYIVQFFCMHKSGTQRKPFEQELWQNFFSSIKHHTKLLSLIFPTNTVKKFSFTHLFTHSSRNFYIFFIFKIHILDSLLFGFNQKMRKITINKLNVLRYSIRYRDYQIWLH